MQTGRLVRTAQTGDLPSGHRRQVIRTLRRAVGQAGQVGDPFRDLVGAVGGLLGAGRERAGRRGQLPATGRDLPRAGGGVVGPRGERLRTGQQRLRAAVQAGRSVGDLVGGVGQGVGGAGQVVSRAGQGVRARRRAGQVLVDGGQVRQHGVDVVVGDLVTEGACGLVHRHLGQGGHRCAGGVVADQRQLGLLRVGAGRRGDVGREVLGDGQHPVVGAVLQSRCGIVLIDQLPRERRLVVAVG